MICPKCNAEVSADSLYCQKCGASLSTKVKSGPDDETKDFRKEMSFFFSPGDHFGNRYKIIEELGRGGMGRVYKAKDKVLNTVVALKMIRPEFLTDRNVIDRFKKEILLAREITHENVVRIYDFGEEKGVKFISMQYIDGTTLKQLIENSGPLPLETIKNITKKICKGLIAAHDKGIVHRDLKPQNIMVDKNGHVYITDFGLAVSSDAPGNSQFGSVVGTPQYISPEQWMGEKIDNRADIYTLGIIMYEMITGCQPFVSDSDIGYFQKHLREKPAFPKVLYVKVPGYFKKIVKKCLEKRKEYRYQDAEALLADLDAGTFSKRSIIFRFKKNRLLRSAAVSLLLLSALYGIYRIGEHLVKKDPPFDRSEKISAAVLPFQNMTPKEKTMCNCSFVLPHLLVTDLEQSKFFKVLPENRVHGIIKKMKIETTGMYSTDALNEISSQGNVDYLITGSCTTYGDRMRITVKTWDVRKGKFDRTESETVPIDDLIPAADRLILKIKKKFKLSDAELLTDIDPHMVNLTSSREALVLYVEGKLKFYNEEYEESIKLYKQAIEIDPDFAMAYKEIAWTYAYTSDVDKRMEYFEKAMAHSENLPAKEKWLIQAMYYGEDEKTYDKAIDAFKKIVKINPENYEAVSQLGGLYIQLEEWDRVIEYCKSAADGKNQDYQAYAYLASAYMYKGQYDKARKAIDRYHKTFPLKTILLEMKYSSYIAERNYERALMIREDIEKSGNDNGIRRGEVYFYRGDLQKAGRIFRRARQSADKKTRIGGSEGLRLIYLLQGKINETVSLLEETIRYKKMFETKIADVIELALLLLRANRPAKAAEPVNKLFMTKKEENTWLFHQKMKLFFDCLYYIKIEQPDKIDISLKKLKKFADSSLNKKDTRYYYYIKGLIEQKKKNYKQAICDLKKAFSTLPAQVRKYYFTNQQALFLFELAFTYYKAGQLNEAELGFDEIIEMTFGRRFFGDLYTKSYYYLGKIFQARGWKGKALEKYKEFLRLWQHADAGYGEAEKQDARRQLERIEKSTNR